jgi:hypothetical protein
MHSYGGLVGSNASPEKLGLERRKKRGLNGGLVKLIYEASFILEKGQSVLGAFGENDSKHLTNPKADGTCTLKDGANLFYNDLPTDQAKLWESRMIPQPFAVKTIQVSRSAYEYIDST